MRPILWGLILSVVSGFFWLVLDLELAVAFIRQGGIPAPYLALVDIPFLGMIFAIPAGIVMEVVRWYRGKKAAKVLTPQAYQPSPPGTAVYCQQCGRQVRLGSLYCDRCGQRL